MESVPSEHGCYVAMGNVDRLRDLVCSILDFGSVPKVAPYHSRDLFGSALFKVRKISTPKEYNADFFSILSLFTVL